MKPSDIQIGKTYRRKDGIEATYLGCGTKGRQGHVRRGSKRLLVLDNGHFVVPYKENPSFWAGFYLVE